MRRVHFGFVAGWWEHYGVALYFTAIDFETANSSPASACQVGLVKVRDGAIVERTGWLIQPPRGFDEFHPGNIRIHGIYPDDVLGCLGWRDQLADLLNFAGHDTLVAHNAGFDMGVIRAACAATTIECPEFDYLCSLQIARRTYSLTSYRLPSAALAAGFTDFQHHNATADAEACAHIVIHAASTHGATSMTELAKLTGVRVGHIGSQASVAR